MSSVPPVVANPDLEKLEFGNIPVLKPEQYEIHVRIRLDRDTTPLEEGFVWPDIVKFRRYFNGKESPPLSARQQELLSGIDFQNFCDNICCQIVSEATGRIEFLNWKCKNPPVKDWLDEFTKLAKVSDRQGQWFTNVMRDGNFCVQVNFDPVKGMVKVYNEEWWNGIRGVFIYYNPAGEAEYAVKEWQVHQVVSNSAGQPQEIVINRRLVWYEDHLERWYNTGAAAGFDGWSPYILETDPKDINGDFVWPIPWVDDDGEPMGIPYIHFPNFGKTYGPYGVSELDGGVLGFQDCINDGQMNITITDRLTGGQMYYATGVSTQTPDGKEIEIKVEPGKFHVTSNPDAKFGVLPAGDIDKQLAAYKNKVERVSQMTQTPLHLITGGDWPSGEALLRAESPAVNKAKRQIQVLTGSMTQMATMAMKLHNHYLPNERIDYNIKDGIIEAIFDDPEKRDIVSKSIVVHNLGPNVSKREALRMVGITEENAQSIYDEIKEEEKDSAEVAAQALTRQTPALGGASNPKGATGGNSRIKSTNGK
jgi:hypothetical protein